MRTTRQEEGGRESEDKQIGEQSDTGGREAAMNRKGQAMS